MTSGAYIMKKHISAVCVILIQILLQPHNKELGEVRFMAQRKQSD